MISSYWPWWLGALSFFSIAMAHYYFMGTVFGVSGSVKESIKFRPGQKNDSPAKVLKDQDVLEEMMLLATMKEFGEEELKEFTADIEKEDKKNKIIFLRVPQTCHITFLIFIMAGGFLSRILQNETFSLHTDMGDFYTSIHGKDIEMIIILLIGGIMLGFGTTMAGGCTSGHGLNGCGRFQKGSLAATFIFFSIGISVTFLLKYLKGI
jgi:uncharacterized protein